MKRTLSNELNQFARQCLPSEVPWGNIQARIEHGSHSVKRNWSGRQKAMTGVAGAAVVVAGLLGMASVSPVVAVALDDTPGVNEIYNWFGEPGLNQAVSFDSKVGQSAVDNGVRLTVTDVYYDKNRLVYQYRIDLSDALIGQPPGAPDFITTVNGNTISVSGGGSCGTASSTAWAGMYELFPYGTLPTQFTMQLTVHKIGSVRGTWTVAFPVSADSTGTHTKVFTPNVTQTADGETLTIKSVTVAPATTTVDYEYNWKTGVLGGMDLWVYTNDGRILGRVGGGVITSQTHGGTETREASALFDTPKDLGSGLFAVPEITPVPDQQKFKSFLSPLNQSLPFTLDEGVLGQVVVNRIEYDSDKTIVTLHYTGPLPFPIGVGLQKGNGQDILPMTGFVSNGNGQYTMTYPAIHPSDKAQYWSAHYETTDLQPKLAVSIPLN